MDTFYLSEAGYSKIRQRTRKNMPYVLGGMALLAAIISAIQLRGETDTSVLTGTIVPFVLIMAVTGIISVRRSMTLFADFRVIITDQEIMRQQKGFPDLRIAVADVSEINQTSKGAIVIKGRERLKAIIIPEWMQDEARMHERLAAIRPITEVTEQKHTIKKTIILALLPVSVMIGLLILSQSTENESVRIVASVLVATMGIGSLALAVRSGTAPKGASLLLKIIIPILVLGLLSTVLMRTCGLVKP